MTFIVEAAISWSVGKKVPLGMRGITHLESVKGTRDVLMDSTSSWFSPSSHAEAMIYQTITAFLGMKKSSDGLLENNFLTA
jgi:hypothetical protein